MHANESAAVERGAEFADMRLDSAKNEPDRQAEGRTGHEWPGWPGAARDCKRARARMARFSLSPGMDGY